MKKKLILLVLIISTKVFALSDVGLNAGGFFEHSNYEVDSKRFLESKREFSIGLQNYNFLDKKNCIGFFEKLSFSSKDDFSLNFLTGAGFGFNIYKDLIRIETGAGFHLLYSFENNNEVLYSNSKIDLHKFSMGLGADFEMKFLPEKMFSPIVGFEAGWDPFCRSATILNGSNYYINYKSFYLIHIRPFAGFVWNIHSQKNNSSQHNDDSQNF